MILSDNLEDERYSEPRLGWIRRDRYGRPPCFMLAPLDSVAEPGIYTFGIYDRIEGVRPGDRFWYTVEHTAAGHTIWKDYFDAEPDVLGSVLHAMEGFTFVEAELDSPGIYTAAIYYGAELDSAFLLASMRFQVLDRQKSE